MNYNLSIMREVFRKAEVSENGLGDESVTFTSIQSFLKNDYRIVMDNLDCSPHFRLEGHERDLYVHNALKLLCTVVRLIALLLYDNTILTTRNVHPEERRDR